MFSSVSSLVDGGAVSQAGKLVWILGPV